MERVVGEVYMWRGFDAKYFILIDAAAHGIKEAVADVAARFHGEAHVATVGGIVGDAEGRVAIRKASFGFVTVAEEPGEVREELVVGLRIDESTICRGDGIQRTAASRVVKSLAGDAVSVSACNGERSAESDAKTIGKAD